MAKAFHVGKKGRCVAPTKPNWEDAWFSTWPSIEVAGLPHLMVTGLLHLMAAGLSHLMTVGLSHLMAVNLSHLMVVDLSHLMIIDWLVSRYTANTQSIHSRYAIVTQSLVNRWSIVCISNTAVQRMIIEFATDDQRYWNHEVGHLRNLRFDLNNNLYL